MLKSNGNNFSGSSFGSQDYDTLAPGDYDGDGKGDLAVWRYTTGTFYYIESSTGTFKTRQFGTVGDEVINRNYDGDGKTDIAVWRETTGTFYILKSGSGTVAATQWGLTSDVPLAVYDSN